ncbi:glycosyltransferase family 2 protein [Longispora sp. K20-0274]|uniref:glycosyltransferase family 2 protein n=1 Tax=Longispora sp. K20-0274 TaxID=3088255 RepID=UPI0039995B79
MPGSVIGLVLLLAWPAHILLMAFASWGGTRPARRRKATAPRPAQYWIIVPCLNEERVVDRTVLAAADLSTPSTPVRVLVIDDGSDDDTGVVLSMIVDPRIQVYRRTAPHARQGKGQALNAAYRYIRQVTEDSGLHLDDVVIGVIDGDGRMEPGALDTVSEYFRDPRVGAVQCRVRIHNRTHTLAALQDLEFAAIANAGQTLRDRVNAVALGGNGQFTRLSALASLGDNPWSECLVEDLELGMRLHLNGVRIRYIPQVAITQQGLVDARRLLRQRTRWAQGNLQCLRYAPRLIASRRIGNMALMDMMYYLLAPWLTILGLVAAPVGLALAWSSLSVATVAATVGTLFGTMAVAGLFWALVHRASLKDASLMRCLTAGLAYPFFLCIGLAATMRGLGRHLTGRGAWAKTERLVEETA